jgi:tetratricopeptide (TPR) repeat protein
MGYLDKKNNSSIQAGAHRYLRGFCLATPVALAFLLSFHTLTGVDIFWHLKAGEIILDTHHVPQKDPFSFTRASKEWIDAQWIFQVIVYGLYRTSGYAGMIVFSALLASLTWLLILAVSYHPKKYLFATTLGLISIIATSSRLKLRPEALTFLFMAFEMFLILQHQQGKKFYLYLVPPLLLLWVNSEGLWPIGFLILLAFLVEEVLFLPSLKMHKYLKRVFSREDGKDKAAAIRLGICFGVSLLLSLANPYGTKGLTFPWRLFRQISFPGSFIGRFIGEFQNPFQHLPWLDLAAYIALIAASAFIFAMLASRRRLSPAAIILWMVFLFLSAVSLRNVALFAIMAAALSGSAFAKNNFADILPLKGLQKISSRARNPLAAALIVIMIPLAADIISSRFYIRNQSYVRFGTGALETEFPIRATRFLKDIGFNRVSQKPAKIFNDLNSAGYLIFTGYPEWKIFTDPRLEVYGEEFFQNYSSMFLDYRVFEREDAFRDFDAVILSPLFKNKLFVRQIYLDSRWALVYMDGLNVVFLKGKPCFSALIQKHGVELNQGLESPLPKDACGPWLARERYGRGSMLLILGEHELAIKELEKAINLDPEDPNINFYTGWALKKLRRYKEARPYLEKTAEKHPEFIPNRIQLAEIYALLGDTDLAIYEFQNILSQDPLEINACIDLAKVYEKVSPEKAESQWQRCMRIYQKNPDRFAQFKSEISDALISLENKNLEPK